MLHKFYCFYTVYCIWNSGNIVISVLMILIITSVLLSALILLLYYISSYNSILLSLDVIGVCKTVEDVSRITTKNSREVSKRTLHLIDTTGKVVAATLWGEEVIITVSSLLFLISFNLLVDLQVKYTCKSTHQSLLLIESILNLVICPLGSYLLIDLQFSYKMRNNFCAFSWNGNILWVYIS